MINDSIIIDVGANFGGFSLEIARRNPNFRVYAIEPEPVLFLKIIELANDMKLRNHIACNFAVSDKNGISDFFVSHEGDWGTSSLLRFDNKHIEHDDYWSSRKDIVHTDTVRVETKRLDEFLYNLEYKDIKFIKIDAQGFDLIALSSLGSHLHRVQAGMIEVVGIASDSLYVDEKNDLRIALNYLFENNFIVNAIKPNDNGSKEFNVYFHRSDVDIKHIETEVSLRDLMCYDGKNYWHYPSKNLEDVESLIHSLKTEIHSLKTEIHSLKTEIHSLKNRNS